MRGRQPGVGGSRGEERAKKFIQFSIPKCEELYDANHFHHNHFRRKGKYHLLEQRQKFPTSENETKEKSRQHRGVG
jgi:hypothetical protein